MTGEALAKFSKFRDFMDRKWGPKGGHMRRYSPFFNGTCFYIHICHIGGCVGL